MTNNLKCNLSGRQYINTILPFYNILVISTTAMEAAVRCKCESELSKLLDYDSGQQLICNQVLCANVQVSLLIH
jgi:hypothetical protein